MPLDILPADVLVRITDFLPTGSVASLALCNKKIWAKIGTQSWKDLSNWRQSPRRADSYRLRKEKAALLTSLQLGLTDWIYCYRCEKLCHRNSHNPNHRSLRCIKATGILDLVYAQGDSETGAPSKVYSLAFLGLQLLMSHYRALRRDTPQDHQLSDSRLTDLLDNLHMVAHFGVGDKGRCVIDARVVDDELLIRMQTQILLADAKGFEEIQIHLPETCQHVSTRGDIFWPSKMELWDQPIWEKTCVYRSHRGVPYRCRYCHTEYLATIKKEPQKVNYLVEVTVWKNLGSFKSPFDKKWHAHCFNKENPQWFFKPYISHGIIYHMFKYANEEGTLNHKEGWLSQGYLENGKLVTLKETNQGLLHPNLARNS